MAPSAASPKQAILLALKEHALSHPTVEVRDAHGQHVRTDYAAMPVPELRQKLLPNPTPEQAAQFRAEYLELCKEDLAIVGGYYEHPTAASSGEPTNTLQITPQGMQAAGSLDAKLENAAAQATGQDMERIKGRVRRDAILSVASIAGAIALGAVAALAASTTLMVAAIVGATLLGGIGIAKAVGVGITSSAVAMIGERQKAQRGLDDAHAVSVPEQALSEMGTAQSSKVEELLAERSRQLSQRHTR